jgi:SAM-dependent methyltransferase
VIPGGWSTGRAKLAYVAKRIARGLLFAPSDLFHHRKRGLVPPRGISNVGRGDFAATGAEFLRYFTELADLRPGDRVLDAGCGVGRMSVPLLGFLAGGSYAGFDVDRWMIAWCRRNIATRRPDFEFALAPTFNRKYNPFGTVAAIDFRFPYPDESFDFAFATSLFTHLPQDEAAHYLGEVARVLRPGGNCFLTFFLLTVDARQAMTEGRARLDFRHRAAGEATTNPRCPEDAIALPVDGARAMLAEAGLDVAEPIHYGAWSDAPDAFTFQDIVVARRGA